MRMPSFTALAVVAVIVIGPAATSFADGTIECDADTGFGSTNPSYYVCVEPRTGGVPGKTCYRWGVRPWGSGTEARHCAG